jgi:hypothetical protein
MSHPMLKALIAGCALLYGCSNGSGTGESGTGGTSAGSGGTSAGSGGTGAGKGGSPGSGGASTGGTTGSGGGTSTGGITGAGGTPATGGATGTGGGTSTGGSSSGGSAGRGAAGSGSGGTSSGGAPGSGGAATGTGGVAGSSGMAGAPGSGGATGGAGTSGGALPGVYTTENTGADCSTPSMSAFSALTSFAALPDPFKMASGSEITSRADWRCRRAEIGAYVQQWDTGTKPAPPSTSNVTATYAGGKLTIKVTANGASITLTEDVTIPSGTGPFPVIIGMDSGATGALPASIFTGFVQVTFHSSDLTPQMPSRGSGPIFSLYPDKTAGSMILWAWGVSRVIDALEMTQAQTNVDLAHIGVTGCSYAGKMALYAGAFDERVALTIPEESGGGGEAAWRVSATMTGTEDLEHAQGTAWYSSNLAQFKDADAPKLPFDQHELAAMVAPRALLTIGNPDIDYLATEAGYVSMKAASQVYQALGIPDRVGFSQVGGHSHCAFPSSQTPDVQAFVDKFLKSNTSANTNIAKSPYTTDLTSWITWTTPQLN